MTSNRYWTKTIIPFLCSLLLCLGLAVSANGASQHSISKDDPQLIPVVQEFKDLIENDPQLLMLFTQMFEMIPDKPEFKDDPSGNPQIRDYKQMLQKISDISVQAPEFNRTGMVGFPINAILNWPMGTTAGTSAFLDRRVNMQLKKILNQWAVFLGSPDSRYVLNNDPKKGWFGRDAQKAMPGFEKDFICDPSKPYHGFKSWDDFFTRQFRKGRRPVASPKNDAVIANACESAPFNLAGNVKMRDQFWIKGQPYSLYHMLDGDPLAAQFEGGTIYQAFLSALSYHRWHSPVSGKIVKTKLIDGSYYAQSPTAGFDPASPNKSQGYITQVAARALIFIEADNPDIGLMAVMFVGMAEVSSNEITVYEGQLVKKGDQLGMFHFGGSTHVLIFRPEVNLDFDLHGQTPGLESSNIPVRSRIATVRKP
ncbi:phosphatidylserine decarboxylase family protein [Maridesulfovibrio salexigens]|uniref:Phosphatidylserine decarboxylase-related n=1 Tax=Maridesulfovibrio salexigens (strain ATCC 14822 / DSM 2638 / NCIMB 8403 / VKM B-1763) TaxID=526222 RepID=C6C103_MARSD|nr:phosphatidylserine decarboxylase family protein [Maridesulfovibrio salexigens]ACS79166.1 phosphatidylserine decarboxylase-related [Maridesulfovibrio salexigens DSM 2638]